MPSSRGYTMDKVDYTNRLRRIEGQVRGVNRMIEEDVYCIEVLTQLSAITRALQAVAVGLLHQHVGHCVRNVIDAGDDGAIDLMVTEATTAIERLVKG